MYQLMKNYTNNQYCMALGSNKHQVTNYESQQHLDISEGRVRVDGQ